MKLLVAIPHFYRAGGDRRYGSGNQPAKARAHRLLRTLLQLHQYFGKGATELDIAQKKARQIESQNSVDVFICIHGDDHLLQHLTQFRSLFKAIQIQGDPKKLGFACHKILGEKDNYDRYLFLEDDLLIHDSEYFHKLDHFESSLGSWALLQPHRFERGPHALTRKCYVDGALKKSLLESYSDPSNPDSTQLNWGHSQVHFEKARNPHSGTFCLSRAQWETWKTNSDFCDQDSSFVGPLESAASLSVMKCFEIYKTIPQHAHHFEIEHQGNGFISQVIQGKLPLTDHENLLDQENN